MNSRLLFYSKTISNWIPNREASILVVAGGKNDRDVFQYLAFNNVVISNIDGAACATDLAPYAWSEQNVEALTYPDEHFEYVVVHAGLHHCRSPHRGLLEMYRVAKTAVIVFEPSDNLLVRLMQRVGLAQIYEYMAVVSNFGQCGGLENTAIPNYIYRWTERDVEQTIKSYAPMTRHCFNYAYGMDVPAQSFIKRSRLKRLMIIILLPVYKLWGKCFPKCQNLFAFMVEKPVLARDLQPWLIIGEGQEVKFNPAWAKPAKSSDACQ